jgi:polyhydroxybutyrate depolymerase
MFYDDRMLRHGSAIAMLGALATAIAGCGDDGAATTGSGGSGGSGGAPPVIPDFEVGGERATTVQVPPGYREGEPAPLVVLLHGYGATGYLEDVYFKLSTSAKARGMFFVAPDGTLDSKGRGFWNATDACCNFEDAPVDDAAYLLGLVDEIASKVAIDPKRIYFVGHSNGAFMSHRMACDHADRVAAFVALAGEAPLDPSLCDASEPVSLLAIHGTADATIDIDGGQDLGVSAGFGPSPAYPAESATDAMWVGIDGCSTSPTTGAPLDLDVSLDGAETAVSSWDGCDAGTNVTLWKIEGGAHIPSFYYYATDDIVDWLLAHPKE